MKKAFRFHVEDLSAAAMASPSASAASLWALALGLALSLTSTLAQEPSVGVLSCSGYVHSSFPLDFSQVEVALFTEHGSKRDSTDCAPSSGYFFLPVEEVHAKYFLKVRAEAIARECFTIHVFPRC